MTSQSTVVINWWGEPLKFLTCATLAGRLAGCMSELLVMLRSVLAAGLHPGMPSGTDAPNKQREVKPSSTGYWVRNKNNNNKQITKNLKVSSLLTISEARNQLCQF